ncbi:hypothetical protein N4R57_17780 [Rhodobacteraceae bacterium D3-12]|nr:hypothetical protein N4R57_17780 [Rhodobacteraceae bacterium D3-12]
MDVTEAPQWLDLSEVAACQPLSDEAGWNQTPDDWDMLLRAGQGFAIRDRGGVPRATVVALPMGESFGWISMVLVTGALRQRGHAKRLMGIAIAWLEGQGLTPVLDATPAGQPLYELLDFKGGLRLRRMSGEGGGRAETEGLRAAMAKDAEWVEALDRAVFGGERGAILRDLMGRDGAVSIVSEAEDGFVLSRKGRNATQIGPVVAGDQATATRLLQAALAAIEGRVFVDAVVGQGLDLVLERDGFKEQRPFLRMARGDGMNMDTPARYFAAAGPELG